LQVEIESDGDPQVVYLLLTQYQDRLNLTFAGTLKRWFQSKFDPENYENNQFLARTLLNFGVYIDQFPLENRANHIEIAIACYRAVLEVYTRDVFPERWAMTQNNLAVAYSDRIRGERSENLENAIACFRSTLEVYTRD